MEIMLSLSSLTSIESNKHKVPQKSTSVLLMRLAEQRGREKPNNSDRNFMKKEGSDVTKVLLVYSLSRS